MLVEFALVSSLSLAQLLSGRLNVERSKYRDHIVSFASAIAITYLLFHFLPEAYSNSKGLVLFVPLITGFVLVHLIEKIYYGKYAARYSIKKVKTLHDELHAVILFVYHFVIGVVLIGILETDLASGVLFLMPLLLFTTIGNWSLHHTYLQQIPQRRFLLASATLIGALFAKSALVTVMIQNIMLNFAAGILLFIIVRESLPQPKEGQPALFVLGIVLYGALMVFLNQFY